MIGNHGCVDGRPTELAPVFPSLLDSADTITYFYDSPRKASESGWNRTPTGIAASKCLSALPCHGQAVGQSDEQPGKAEACAAAYMSPCWYGVSGHLPHDMYRGLDSSACDAAPGPEE
eukprot:8324905-Pyramimonas_sp.AAC.1